MTSRLAGLERGPVVVAAMAVDPSTPNLVVVGALGFLAAGVGDHEKSRSPFTDLVGRRTDLAGSGPGLPEWRAEGFDVDRDTQSRLGGDRPGSFRRSRPVAGDVFVGPVVHKGHVE